MYEIGWCLVGGLFIFYGLVWIDGWDFGVVLVHLQWQNDGKECESLLARFVCSLFVYIFFNLMKNFVKYTAMWTLVE
jgi:hypothetical protein